MHAGTKLPSRQRRIVLLVLFLLAIWVGVGATERLAARYAPEPARVPPPIAVETLEIQPRLWVTTRRYTGTVEAEQEAVLAARISANVVEVLSREGMRVDSGHVLVRLDDEELRHEAERLAAVAERIEAELRLARRTLSRQEDLHRQKLIADQLLDEARQRVDVLQAQTSETEASLAALRTRIGYAQLLAPFSGVVQQRHAQAGEFVPAGSPLVTLVAVDAMRAVFHVPQVDAAHIEEGMPVKLTIPAMRGEAAVAWEARVDHVYPALDPRTRNASIDVLLPESVTDVRPGMAARAEVEISRHSQTLLVPVHALRQSGEHTVILLAEEGFAREHRIETGFQQQGLVEVRQGLESGAQVILGADRRISDGSPVSLVTPVRTERDPG